MISDKIHKSQLLPVRDGNFAPFCLTCPTPLCPAQVLPAPQRWWGSNGARFQLHTMGQGGVGFRLFRPTPPYPSPSPSLSPSPPRPMLLRVIIVKKFHTLKPYYLNKHINITLFYSTKCGYLPLFCYVLYYKIFFFFFCDCLVKHLDILFNFFLKIDLIL